MRKIRIVAITLGALVVAGFLTSCRHDTDPGSNGLLNGSLAATGGVYAHVFGSAGTFHYRCTIHPTCTSLQGTVYVVSTATPILSAHDVTAIQFTGGSATT